MGKEESTQLVVKNVGLDDFNEYVEQDFIEKLSQRGILFLSGTMIKLLQKSKEIVTITNSGKKFQGGVITKIENGVRYDLLTYQKLGIIGHVLGFAPFLKWPITYKNSTSMIIRQTSPSDISINLVHTPMDAAKKNVKKIVIVLAGIIVISFTLLASIIPPPITMFVIVVLLPIILLRDYGLKRVDKKYRTHLINTIREVIRSDYQTDM